MPHRLVPLVVTGIVLATPSPALAQSGGAAAPTEQAGGFYGTGAVTATLRLQATTFQITPDSVVQGAPVRFSWQIDGPVRKSFARVALVPAGGGPALQVRLGVRRIGTRATRTWIASVPAGRYVARLYAKGPQGARLRRTARASGQRALDITAVAAPAPVPLSLGSRRFPVQGLHSFGADDARFGARRSGHVHQGQDILAAEGTPIVSPVAGVVHWRAYQASGAGHYVVVRGDDGRDYVFMHMQDGSVVAEKGRRVAASERLGNVGNTGASSGAHLHFEIWPDGWYAKDSQPIDPLPDLLAWGG